MSSTEMSEPYMSKAEQPLNQAAALEASGDFRAALEALEAALRTDTSPAIEQALMDLRIRAFAGMQWPNPPDHWQPDYDDRFAAVETIPEIDASELSTEALLAGILGKGALIVRNLMDAELAAQMRGNIDHTLEARRAAFHDEDAGDSSWFVQSSEIRGSTAQFRSLGGKERFTNTGSVWSAYSPTTACQLIEFYRSLGLPTMLEHYFGEPAVLSAKKWVLRCAPPNNGAQAGWHQDGRFLGDGSIRTVNLWMALTDCGGDADAPGIEIVAGNRRVIHPTGTHGAHFDWTVGPELVEEIGQTQPVVCPRFNVGDAIFFDHYNLHRTAFGQDHSVNRYAVESWFFASSTAPSKQIPLVVDC